MKKLFFLLVMVAMLLPSCQKIEDRIDGLEDRVDQIERTQIATINQQIDAINTTLPQLRDADAELKEYIESLQNTAANLQEQITNTNKDIDELEAALNKAIADAEASDDALKAELVAQLNTAKADILAQLESTKTALEAELAQINSTIATLQAKDTELEGKITTLEEYVNTELQNIKDWANATFATLEQYNTIVEDVTTIKAQIEAINTSISKLEERLNTKIATDIATAVEGLEGELAAKVIEITTAYTTAISTAKEELTAAYTEAIATAIAKLESSMKEWVNEQLTGYYTIAEIDAALELLKKSVTDGDAAVLEEVARLSDRIEAIKTDITQAYQSAIAEAINNNNGVIEGKIADEVSAVNSRIDSEITTINAKISAIESRLDKVESDIADLLSRVQSISYVPTYSDGKATLKCNEDSGYIDLDFEVSPKEVLPTLADVWESAVTVKAVVTETRAAEFIILPVESFEVDAANGIVSLRVVGDKLLSLDLDDNQGISVAMSITDGNSSVVSEYIPVVFVKNLNISRVTAMPIAVYTWKLQLWENDPIYGYVCTNIIVKMAEKNTAHINAGSYSVFDGSIIPGAGNANSYYRANNYSFSEAIIDAELIMEIDKENEKTIFSGTFATASSVFEFSWNGVVEGFSYEEVVILDNYTGWSSFTIKKDTSGNDDRNFEISGTSADGSLTVWFDIFEYKYSGFSDETSRGYNCNDPISAGTYTVSAFRVRPEYDPNDKKIDRYQTEGEKYCCAENSKANGYALESGEVVVEIVGDSYKVSFNVVDILGQTWKGEAICK